MQRNTVLNLAIGMALTAMFVSPPRAQAQAIQRQQAIANANN